MRIGYGYDVHRLEEGRPLILGGVEIPHSVGLAGHSDADVLAHAIIDALLGAAALGDIGQHFPDTDPKWKGADSLDLLARTAEILTEHGWTVANVDATVVIEKPRLSDFIEQMRGNLASAMGASTEAVSVKATTGERIGFVGRMEGAAAHAVCFITRRES